MTCTMSLVGAEGQSIAQPPCLAGVLCWRHKRYGIWSPTSTSSPSSRNPPRRELGGGKVGTTLLTSWLSDSRQRRYRRLRLHATAEVCTVAHGTPNAHVYAMWCRMWSGLGRPTDCGGTTSRRYLRPKRSWLLSST